MKMEINKSLEKRFKILGALIVWSNDMRHLDGKLDELSFLFDNGDPSSAEMLEKLENIVLQVLDKNKLFIVNNN